MWKGKEGVVPDGFESDQYYIKNVTYAKLAALLPGFVASAAAAIAALGKEDKMVLRYFRRDFFASEKHILGSTFRAFENFEFWDLHNTAKSTVLLPSLLARVLLRCVKTWKSWKRLPVRLRKPCLTARPWLLTS
jgi:hypothetical protein